MVVGFFLREFIICSQEYLEDEFNHISEGFRRLDYPKGLILKLGDKAKRIRAGRVYEEKFHLERKQENFWWVPVRSRPRASIDILK